MSYLLSCFIFYIYFDFWLIGCINLWVWICLCNCNNAKQYKLINISFCIYSHFIRLNHYWTLNFCEWIMVWGGTVVWAIYTHIHLYKYKINCRAKEKSSNMTIFRFEYLTNMLMNINFMLQFVYLLWRQQMLLETKISSLVP